MRAYARVWGEDEERYAVTGSFTTSTTSGIPTSRPVTRESRWRSWSGSATRRT